MKLLKLENRIVLDAAAAIEAAQYSASLPVATPSVDSQPLEVVSNDQQPVVADVVAALSLEPAGAEGLNIALVANNLNNYSELTDSLTAQGVIVITFDTQTDSSEAVLQRVEALAVQQNSSIASLSVVSHGGGGRFALGNEMITAESLAQDTSAWSALQDNFSSNSSVYLFGCNVVDGSGRGQALLDSLASSTGSNIFASNDLTGVGGDWVLEAASVGADPTLATPDSRMLVALAGFEGSLANTPPVISLPVQQTVNEDLVLAVSGISVSDPDVPQAQEGARVVEVTLNVTNLTGVTVSDGLLTLGQNAGLIFTPSAVGVVSDGIADSQMSFLGSITDVNAALASLSFQGAANFNGDVQVQVSVNDRGNIDTAISLAVDPNQIGVPIITSTAFGITVVAVNDVPVNTVPAGVQNAIEDTPLVFAGSVIQVSDVDANGAPLQVTLVATNGTVSLASLAGLTLVNGTGTADSSVTVTGSAAAINNALNGASFNAAPNFVGAATLTLTTSDQNAGAQGLGGVGIASNVIDINVSGVNDAPVNSLPVAALTVVEDTPFVMTVAAGTALQVSDVDVGAGSLQVSLSVDSGSVILSQVTGLTFAVGSGVLGAANGSVTFSGSVANINAALDGLSYASLPNFNGAVNLQISTNDLNNAGLQGVGGALTTADNVTLNVVAVNDGPVNQLPTVNLSLVEDTPLVFNGLGTNPAPIVVSDLDIGNGLMAITLTVDSGTLTLAPSPNLQSVLTNGTGQIVFTGTVAAVNTALNGLVYTPAANFNGAVTLNIASNDQNNGAQGIGAAITTQNSLVLSVTPVNDLPVTTLPVGTFTVVEDTALLFNGIGTNPAPITVSDADLGTVLQVTLSVPVASGTLTLSPSPNLTVLQNNGSANVTLTGTAVDINTALSGMSFNPAANFNGVVTLSVVSSDQSGAPPVVSNLSLAVTASNDAPILTLPAAATVAEDGLLALSGIVVSDVDVGTGVMEVSLTLGSGAPPTQGSLTLASSAGLTFVVGSASNVSAMTFRGTLADINTALASLSYQPNANVSGVERLNVTVNDGGNSGVGGVLSDAGGLDITVTAVNDAPILSVPGAQAVNEDTDLPINGISISDVDVGTGVLSVSLSAGSGVLSVTQTAGLQFSVGNGNQDGSMTFSGTLVDVNAALASVVFYRPNLNFNGSDAITIVVNDLGNSGAPGALSDTATIAVTINAVNDAPVLTLPAAQTVAEEAVLALNSISIADVDAGVGIMTVTLSLGDAQNPAHGILNLAGTTGLNFELGSTFTGSSMTFNGSLNDINNALGTLTYTGNLNFNGSDQLTVMVNDGGSVGSGGPQIDSGTVAIEITPVNDAPLWNVPGNLAVNEDISLAVNGVSIGDVDAGVTPLSVTLSVNNGSLSLGQVTGLSFAPSSTPSNLTFSGSLTDLNAALATLTYQGNANFFGSDQIQLSVDDQGGGGGAALSDSGLIDVVVSPINDGPSIALSVSVLSYREGGLPVVLDAGLQVSDPDSTNLQSATVTVGNVQQGDLLAFTSSANISGNYDAASGVLTLTADPLLGATVADFQTALQSVTYVNTLNTVPTGLRPVTFSATDGADSGLSPRLTLSVNSGFTAVPTTPGTVTPADPRPPLNGIQTATGGLTSIPSSNLGLLGGVNLSAGSSVPQGAQLLSPDSASGSGNNSASFQALSVQSVRAGGDALKPDCSLDEIFKRVDMGCRFANVEAGFEETQYLSVASGQEVGWQYPMSDENQGLIDQLVVGESEELGLNQQPGDFSAAYLGDRPPISEEADELSPALPQELNDAGSGDDALDSAVELFTVEPAAGASVNIQPLAPLSEVGDVSQTEEPLEVDDSREEGELILEEDELLLEDEPLPADAELAPDLDANVQILGRAVNLLDKGSLG